MKKLVISWIFAILTLVLFLSIRLILGYQVPPAWYWMLILSIIALQFGKFLYYILYGANIDRIVYQGMEDGDIKIHFTFQFNPIKLSRVEYGLASFDSVAYPELKDPRVLQQILYGQTTRKEVRVLTDNLRIRESNPTKKYRYKGKTYEIEFYSRPMTPGNPPFGLKV